MRMIHMSLRQGGTPPDYAAFKGSVHEHVALAVDDKGHGLGTVLEANLFKGQRCLGFEGEVLKTNAGQGLEAMDIDISNAVNSHDWKVKQTAPRPDGAAP